MYYAARMQNYQLLLYCLTDLVLVYFIRNEALRVAFIHAEESVVAEGKISKEFYSKLVKADINGKDQAHIKLVALFFLDIRSYSFHDLLRKI